MEESVLGGEELELEVVRDAKNQMITVSFSDYRYGIGFGNGDATVALDVARGFGDDVTFNDPVDGTDFSGI